MNEILEYNFLNNKVADWLVVLGTICVLFLVILLFKRLVLAKVSSWARKTDNKWDDFIIDAIKYSLVPIAYISAVYFSLKALEFSATADNVLGKLYAVAVTFYIVKLITRAFRKLVHTYINAKDAQNTEAKFKQAAGLVFIVTIVIWILGGIFLLDNFGYNVTALLTGLGIGGIAIALAAQTIVGDLFSYFIIFFDRPFEIGDFITVDDKAGTIESIGLKTTRIRTLSGEQLVCSNKDLTESRVHNFKRLMRRRVLFQVGVLYQTTAEQLEQIPGIIKNAILAQENVEFDRSHFSGFGDSSLNFESVFFVLNADYSLYMSRQEAIFLNIFREFEKRGIEFAYPTQTIFVDGLPEIKLNMNGNGQMKQQEKKEMAN